MRPDRLHVPWLHVPWQREHDPVHYYSIRFPPIYRCALQLRESMKTSAASHAAHESEINRLPRRFGAINFMETRNLPCSVDCSWCSFSRASSVWPLLQVIPITTRFRLVGVFLWRVRANCHGLVATVPYSPLVTLGREHGSGAAVSCPGGTFGGVGPDISSRIDPASRGDARSPGGGMVAVCGAGRG